MRHAQGLVRHDWHWDCACLQQEAGAFLPGVRSQSLCVHDVTKPPSTEVQGTLVAGAAVGSNCMCPVSRTGGFGCCRFVGPRQTLWALPGSCCRPVLTTAGTFTHVSHLSAALSTTGDFGDEILAWACSGKWLREEIPLSYPARGVCSPVGGDVVVAASIPGQLHLSKESWWD